MTSSQVVRTQRISKAVWRENGDTESTVVENSQNKHLEMFNTAQQIYSHQLTFPCD